MAQPARRRSSGLTKGIAVKIDWQKYLPTIKDGVERAAKTFAGGFIVGANLLGAVANTLVGQVNVAASQINWAHGLDVGLGTTVVSALFSLASLKFGNPGTASVTKAVEIAPPSP